MGSLLCSQTDSDYHAESERLAMPDYHYDEAIYKLWGDFEDKLQALAPAIAPDHLPSESPQDCPCTVCQLRKEYHAVLNTTIKATRQQSANIYQRMQSYPAGMIVDAILWKFEPY